MHDDAGKPLEKITLYRVWDRIDSGDTTHPLTHCLLKQTADRKALQSRASSNPRYVDHVPAFLDRNGDIWVQVFVYGPNTDDLKRKAEEKETQILDLVERIKAMGLTDEEITLLRSK